MGIFPQQALDWSPKSRCSLDSFPLPQRGVDWEVRPCNHNFLAFHLSLLQSPPLPPTTVLNSDLRLHLQIYPQGPMFWRWTVIWQLEQSYMPGRQGLFNENDFLILLLGLWHVVWFWLWGSLCSAVCRYRSLIVKGACWASVLKHLKEHLTNLKGHLFWIFFRVNLQQKT